MWLGQSEGGPATVWRNSGFQAQRISTHSLAAQIAGYGATAQAAARAFAYTDRDHAFYVLSFPTVNQTHVYDAATGLWADRGYWNTSTGLWEVYKPAYHCFAFGRHLVGDGVTGAIYDLSPTTYTDAGGVPLRALRQGPYVVDQQQRLYHRDFWLDVETGGRPVSESLYRDRVLADNPVAYWPLNDTSGNAADASGNARTLTATGTPTYGVVGPRVDAATGQTFTANTAYQSRTLALLGGTNLGDDWSIECWANTPAAAQGELVSQSVAAGTTSFIHLYIYNGDYTVEVVNQAAGAIFATAAGSYAPGWHHVVATWDASAGLVTLYVDGESLAQETGTAGAFNAMDTTAIGTRLRGGVAYGGSSSTVQDVALYTTALSAERVKWHADALYGGLTATLTPQVMLSRTDDKGKTWPAFSDKAIGAQGDVNTRVEWKRLGSAKQRAYRTVITDPVPRRIADAYLEIDKGGGQ
jgi:hypothetical protein